MTITSLRVTAAALLLTPLVLTGCGDDSSGGGGDKPSQQEVAAGLKKFYDGQGAQYTQVLDTGKLADCMAGKAQSTMSAKSLNAMKEGNPTAMDPADTAKLTTYGGECGKAAAKVPAG